MRVAKQSLNRGGVRFGDWSDYNHEPAGHLYERDAFIAVDIRLLASL